VTLVVCKVGLLLRLQQLRSPLNNISSKLIMSMSNIEANQSLMFFKSWIKLNPLETLGLGFVLYIPLASYILMVTERSNYHIDFYGFHQTDACFGDTNASPGGHTDAPLDYMDSLWLVVITFLTVGYGDFYPSTYIGRMIAVVTVLYGQIYAAMIIGLVHNQLRPTEIDKVVYEFLANKKRSDQLRRYAGKAIMLLLKANVLRRRLSKARFTKQSWRDDPRTKNMFIQVCVNVTEFKKVKRVRQNHI